MTPTTRRGVLIAAALTGIAAGVVVSMALSDPSPPTGASGAGPTTSAPATTHDATSATDPADEADEADVLLVWTSGGLPDGFDEAVRALDGVEALTMVRGDETAMTASSAADGEPVDTTEPGWHIPLDTLAVDPDSFHSFLSSDAAEVVGALEPGKALLTETSARLRRLGVSATIRLAVGASSADVTVAGVIDDLSGAGAELLVAAADADRLGVTTARYLLVSHTGERDLLQRAIADRLDGRAVRFRSRGETTWLRHGDAVEPPAVIKTAFGEFAIRERSGRDVDIDPAWVARSIVTEPVPILGRVTCHRLVVGPLRAALDELEAANLAHLVEAADFAGCFGARRITPGQPLSHHAWGAALDLNVDGNPRGSFSTQDPRLVETMTRHGFTWGGTWLVPDPAHYEAPVPAP